MNRRSLGTMLALYGVFLVVAGLVGFALTGETSTSSILNGGIFGSLMIGMGILLRQGRMWTFPASLSAVGVFTLTFIWRGVVQARRASAGEPEHLGVSILLFAMFAVSALMLALLFKHYRH